MTDNKKALKVNPVDEGACLLRVREAYVVSLAMAISEEGVVIDVEALAQANQLKDHMMALSQPLPQKKDNERTALLELCFMIVLSLTHVSGEAAKLDWPSYLSTLFLFTFGLYLVLFNTRSDPSEKKIMPV
jgi:hypothetical protein